MMIFCTLFDSNYLDKGLAMYRSLVDNCPDFRLYVLAMDDKCEEVLNDYKYENLTTINLNSFVDKVGLRDIQKTRTHGSFCWTCTSFLIDYVLSVFGEPICTYVDSYLFFYSNPQCLIDEMGDKTVQIVEHRFNPTIEGRLIKNKSGTYCVEFNTFKNTENAIKLLHWWEDRCVESCSLSGEKNKVFGDQYYLEKWGEKDFVSVLQNPGGGVAPWNIAQYQLSQGCAIQSPVIIEKKTKKEFKLVFYHYHYISYYSSKKVNIHVYRDIVADDSLVHFLYYPYLTKLNTIKNELKDKYGVYPLLIDHPAFIENKKKRKSLVKKLWAVDKKTLFKLYVIITKKILHNDDLRRNTLSF